MFDFLKLFDGEGGAEAAPSAESSTAPQAESADNGVATEPAKTEKTFTQSELEGIIKDRVKNSTAKIQEYENKMNSYNPVFEILKERFGTDDVNEWANRLSNDPNHIREEAERRGLTEEATRTVLNLERETKRLKAQQEAAERDRQWAEQVTKWRGEEAELQNEFPNFTLDEEFENPSFRTLINNGFNVRQAYMGVHAEDILKGSIQYAVERGMEIQADNVIAGKSRPSENATSSVRGTQTSKRVADMTDQEFDELVKRVNKSRGTGSYIKP